MPPKSKKPKFQQHCQLCGATTTHRFRHLRRVHLPWYLDPTSACIDCHMSAGKRNDLRNVHGCHQLFSGEAQLQGWFLLMNGLFLFLSQQLGLGSPIELLGCSAVQELTPGFLRFSEEELFFLRDYDMRAGMEPVSSGVYMSIPPSRLIALIHPDLMTSLLLQINHEAIKQLSSYTRYTLTDGSLPIPGFPTLKRGVIDTHFHLDKLSNHACISLSDLEGSRFLPVRLPFAIANYVFPSMWTFLNDHVKADSRMRITLGVHPHLITRFNVNDLYTKLEKFLQCHPEAVGIGEVGIDIPLIVDIDHVFTKQTCLDRIVRAQRQFLSLVLQLAKRENKVLVLHVRDSRAGEAARDVLSLLKELRMTDHPIHRHCLVGGIAEYKDWVRELPNCYFSMSPITISDPKTMSALNSLDNRKRLLLE